MIISRSEIASAISGYKTVKRKSAVNGAGTVDSYERSEAADALVSVLASSTEPFYRPNLVEHLRRQISEGRYFVPSDQIVEKLLGRLIVEAAIAA
ncbi:MAG TPA: flagellar biosynthesis anti-sigma factor FlgM [Candidatus Elarobacter sp.]|jgi:anti-sigma28 factor (negative regulator of flagellin synthesis)